MNTSGNKSRHIEKQGIRNKILKGFDIVMTIEIEKPPHQEESGVNHKVAVHVQDKIVKRKGKKSVATRNKSLPSSFH